MSSFVLGGAVRLMFGVGMGLIIAPATESIMGSLPQAKAGVGSAVNDTTRQTGGALGVAVIGSIFAAGTTPRHDVAGLPAAAQADVRDSIGKALAVAERLPAEQQRVIRSVADQRRTSPPCGSPSPSVPQ